MRAKSLEAVQTPTCDRCRRGSERAHHAEAVRQLAQLHVPPGPSIYDPQSEIGALLRDQTAFLRRVIDILEPIFSRVADDAADYGGARAESFDIVRAAAEDYLAPITLVAERLIGED